ncbi:hypothetical protein [Fibrobacter sp.]|uniref:hypothetical protein n=1 Tax=Fibrobacter sp. TaxID=35828 RepID=UPI0025BAD163|nr:hypothetical protein [Fibrobacter sp.]
MGFFFWFLCSILVVALVLLLFPFSVRIEFEAGERGARAFFYFFKKKVYEYEKKWGEESRKSEVGSRKDEVGGDESEAREGGDDSADTKTGCHPERNEVKSKDLERLETRDDRAEDGSHELSSWSEPQANDRIHRTPEAEEKEETAAVAKRPTETLKTEKMGNEVGSRKSEVGSGTELDDRRKSKDESGKRDYGDSSADTKTECHPERNEVKSKDLAKSSSVIEVSSTKKDESEKPSGQASEAKVKKPKPKLSDREFWTILLTPDLDARVFKYALKIIAAVFSLFRIRFSDCFVEGIRTDYQTMGYIAALNGILKAYPFVGDWDLRMDWLHEKELRATGNVRLSITLLRIFCFVLETLVLAGILAFIFWRRRAHVLKTKELPEIGFIRKKIVDFILED